MTAPVRPIAVSRDGDPADETPHVVVIGGGISGLAAALRSSESQRPTRVTLVERAARFGGWIHTVRTDGWLIERGPDLFLASKPGAWELCERLGITDRLHGTTPGLRAAYVRGHGRLNRLPEGLTGLVPSRIGPFVRSRVLSPRGKLRVALEPLIPRRHDDDDESIESFVVRRLGREMYERLVEPLLSGIYAGDGAQLSVLATFPQLRAAEREAGGVLRSMMRTRANDDSRRRGFVTLPDGMGELVDVLVRRLEQRGVLLRASAGVDALERRGDRWRMTIGGDALTADAVIVATSASAAADLIAPVSPETAAALGEIPHASTMTVSLGYRSADVPLKLDATGYVVPRAEGKPVLACTWSSAKFGRRAPMGHALLRVFLGGVGRGDVVTLDDGAAVQLARGELREVLGIRAEPSLVDVARQPDAMPQYLVGHRDRVSAIERTTALLPTLAVAGNAYRGVGIPDCVRSGEAAADRVLAALSNFR